MKKEIVKTKNLQTNKSNETLFDTIATLIKESRHRVSVTVNSELALLYWHIGKTIKKEVLKEKRAEYGKQIIEELSAKLTEFFGKGWGEKHLNHCLRSAVTFQKMRFSTRCVDN